MEKYISKAAVMAEIKARIETYNKGYANGDDCRADALETFLHDIDFLEVKEVDLDFEHELYKAFGQVKDFTLGMCIARHFYELGLRAKKVE